MIFWILLGLLIVAPFAAGMIYLFAERRYGLYASDFWSAWGITFVITVLAFGLGAGIMGTGLSGGSWATNTSQTRTDAKLQALGNKTEDNVSGGFFLIFGSVSTSSSQKISYVSAAPDGGFKLHTVGVSKAEVFEDASTDTAHLVTITPQYSNPWLVPWREAGTTEYAFHVPAGTVDRTYDINVNK